MFGKKKRALLLAEPWDQPRMSDNVTQFMEKLGLSDDEIAEMSNPINDLQRTIAASNAALATFVMETNASWSKQLGAVIELQPYAMLPATCWDALDTPHQTLLMDVVGLIPTQPWNNILLAMNDETANLVGVGRYPTGLSEEATTAAGIANLSITEELELVKKQQGAIIDTPGHETAEVKQVRRGAAARIIALARPVASASLGQDAVDHSRATFFGD